MRLFTLAATALSAGASVLTAQAPASAPLSNITYDLTFNRETAANRTIHVVMNFQVGGQGEALLSLPDWTPGAYEITNFARWVSAFEATSAGKPLDWDKLDYDTWRVNPAGAKQVTVAFDVLADSLDNAMAWARDDFAFFNGTNLLLYPEGRGMDFSATVRVNTESDWQVATGMPTAGAGRAYREGNYHDLVDMPFFVGHIDYDSTTVNGLNVRLATWPAGVFTGQARADFWSAYGKLFAPQAAVFGETPYPNYTTLIVFDSTFGGGSALEHQSSHLGIYTTQGIGQEWVVSVTAHEMFHAFNVKRLRPAEMVPYRYDRPQPTPWLWVSEGITDYYADLTLLRAGIVDSASFLNTTAGKIANVANTVPVALEDASLSTWIHPTDGTGYIYYPKGSLAGFMLDIIIRDASDNRQSLDGVMRSVYQSTYQAGKGFGAADWWGAVSRAAGGRSFTEFNERYVDGREPFPWDSLLPKAGLRLVTDTVYLPRIGINTAPDSSGGIRVVAVAPGTSGADAGLRAGDVLMGISAIEVNSPDAFQQFRDQYGSREGADITYRIVRDGQPMSLPAKVRLASNITQRIEVVADAPAKAVRVRHGMFTGTTAR